MRYLDAAAALDGAAAARHYPVMPSPQESLATELLKLSSSQLDWVRSVVAQFQLPHTFWRDPASDWITPHSLDRLGDALRIHHAFSRQALSKDRFEFAFERTLNLSGIPAELVKSRTNRGHDITISGIPVSLKTEAAAGIRSDSIHVSKWMELGKGPWILQRLLDLFLGHMHGYERIATMRCLKAGPSIFEYELVEIPKALLLESATAELVIQVDSRQNPQPGYGYVRDANGAQKFALYFDGGTERKLQIKHLRKDLCRVHATWKFDSAPL